MLISHRKQFIYTKTIKTAGTSVESYFEKYCMPEGEWNFSHPREEYVSASGIIGYRGTNAHGKKWYNHMSAAAIKALIGDEIWNSYFKFCVVRNPFDKAVSAFYFFNGNREITDDVTEFRKWVQSNPLPLDRDKYAIDNRVCMDFFVRFESLNDDMKQVCDRLGVEFEPEQLPLLKKGMRNEMLSLAEYYDDASIEAVRRVYEPELEFFGYRPPES